MNAYLNCTGYETLPPVHIWEGNAALPDRVNDDDGGSTDDDI